MSDLAEMVEIADELQENENTEKFLVFSIMGKLYSFPSRLIGEIALYDMVYPLPLMPSYVLGVVNRYSVPYALFDIGILFYQKPSPRNKVLIFKDEIDHIAFLIDDVSGIADINHNNLYIMERGADSTELTDAVVATFNWNNNDVFVLDVHRILTRVTKEIS
jgi:purine-binding chemotaxis protein CheW